MYCSTYLQYCAAIPYGLVRLSVCPERAPNLKTQRHRVAKIVVNVPQGRSNRCANFKFKSSKFRVTRRQKPLRNDAYLASLFALARSQPEHTERKIRKSCLVWRPHNVSNVAPMATCFSRLRQTCVITRQSVHILLVDKYLFGSHEVLRTCLPVVTQIYFCLLIVRWKE